MVETPFVIESKTQQGNTRDLQDPFTPKPKFEEIIGSGGCQGLGQNESAQVQKEVSPDVPAHKKGKTFEPCPGNLIPVQGVA